MEWGTGAFMFVIEFLLELLIQVVARFIGVAFCAFFSWCGSGFRTSYRSEWKRLFAKYPGTYEWVDLLGVIILLASVGGSLLAVHAMTRRA